MRERACSVAGSSKRAEKETAGLPQGKSEPCIGSKREGKTAGVKIFWKRPKKRLYKAASLGYKSFAVCGERPKTRKFFLPRRIIRDKFPYLLLA